MKHQKNNIIKHSINTIMLCSIAFLSVSLLASDGGQDVTYGDKPIQFHTECTVSTDPEKTVELVADRTKTDGGCAGLTMSNYQTYLASTDDYSKLDFDDNGNLYHYVATLSKTANLSSGNLWYDGKNKSGYQWVKNQNGMGDNSHSTMTTYCAPIECNDDNQ